MDDELQCVDSVVDRLAEIAPDHVLDELHVLDCDGLIEAEGVPERGDRLQACVRWEHEADRVATQACRDECQCDDVPKRNGDLDDPVDQVPRHRR